MITRPDWCYRYINVTDKEFLSINNTKLSPVISEHLKNNLKITKFTPIQQYILTLLLDNIKDQCVLSKDSGDICVAAPTGMGKTLCYVLPILQVNFHGNTNDVININKISSIVLCPTRELVTQVEEIFVSFLNTINNKFFICQNINKSYLKKVEIDNFEVYPRIVVGTPSRLIKVYYQWKNEVFWEAKENYFSDDLLIYGELFQNIDFIILDEADRVLDSDKLNNFDLCVAINKICSIQHKLKTEVSNIYNTRFHNTYKICRKMLFAATLTSNPEKMFSLKLIKPIYILCDFNKTSEVSPNIKNYIIKVESATDKYKKLLNLLVKISSNKVLIFCNKRVTCDRLFNFLNKETTYKVIKVTGVLHRYYDWRSRDINIIIATDLFARGLDDPSIKHVINLEVPLYYKTYIHRVGRTGRGSETGNAFTFVQNFEKWQELELLICRNKNLIEEYEPLTTMIT